MGLFALNEVCSHSAPATHPRHPSPALPAGCPANKPACWTMTLMHTPVFCHLQHGEIGSLARTATGHPVHTWSQSHTTDVSPTRQPWNGRSGCTRYQTDSPVRVRVSVTFRMYAISNRLTPSISISQPKKRKSASSSRFGDQHVWLPHKTHSWGRLGCGCDRWRITSWCSEVRLKNRAATSRVIAFAMLISGCWGLFTSPLMCLLYLRTQIWVNSNNKNKNTITHRSKAIIQNVLKGPCDMLYSA